MDHLCERLLVGISGSIHSLQIHSYLMLFRESFAKELRVIMTANAARMVAPESVELYTDDRVFIDPWDRSASVNRAPHIQLTRWADLFVVVPASANTLGKAANGIADDLLSTAVLSSRKRVVFAPAMNPDMWHSKATQRNVGLLSQDGHYVITPHDAISVTSDQWDRGLSTDPETVLSHLQHVRMRELRDEYWHEATSTKPLTPAQKKMQELIVAHETRLETG